MIVAVGASAGGLSAFSRFLDSMPPDSGMGFILLQHLSADHDSFLAQLLGGHSKMPVVIATEGTRVLPDSVYVVPPGKGLAISGGCLQLTPLAERGRELRLLDRFFSSLADDLGERAVCVILSGSGNDGTVGLRAIKERGGLAIAQSKVGAAGHAEMPDHALDTGLLDALLPVEDMGAFLLNYMRYIQAHPPGQAEPVHDAAMASSLAEVLHIVKQTSGNDFAGYKEVMLLRRVERRMGILQIREPDDYVKLITDSTSEPTVMMRDFLIGVTQFFRDRKAFEALRRLLPSLLAKCSQENPLRIWVPACSSGEEVYTLAILVREAMEATGITPRVQIFGTDIEAAAIATARAGRYHRRAINGVPKRSFNRWFVDRGGVFELARELREMCVFSVHNVLRDPPFSRLHLISCRNLMIYLKADTQEFAVKTFHFALRTDGLLFLGIAEGLGRLQSMFSVVDKRHHIYRHSGLAAPAAARARKDRTLPLAGVPRPLATLGDDWLLRGSQRAIARYAPAHVVIDATYQVIRFSGGTVADYLDPSPGRASLELFSLLRTSLQAPVRKALTAAARTSQQVVEPAVMIETDGAPRVLEVIVEPLYPPVRNYDTSAIDQAPNPFFVVAFHRKGFAEGEVTSNALEAMPRHYEIGMAQIETLNDELRLVIEEHQATNEELLSANEELEASREEMQSVIEELQTVNVEMGAKNEFLVNLNNDVKNLLDSTQIATLFLDDQMQVRSYTPRMAELFSLRLVDVGRPVVELATRIDYDTLIPDFNAVSNDHQLIEREIKTLSDPVQTFILRMRAYERSDGSFDGVVMTFVNITERKSAEDQLRHLAQHDAMTGLTNRAGFHAMLERATRSPDSSNAPSGLLLLDLDRFKSVNDSFGHRTGDIVLQMVADRLRRCVRASDSVHRLGGDEFAILQYHMHNNDDTAALASRIVAAISAPYDVEGRTLKIGVSIGIAFRGTDAQDVDWLPRAADIALYEAKARGGDCWQFFRPGMQQRLQERHQLELDLHKALAQGELELLYQPLVRIADRAIVGAEALLRWRHPHMGLLSPAIFIPIAEESGLIVPIGAWVLQRACLDAATWPEEVRLSVNLSSIQFASRDLLKMVSAALETARLPPKRLTLEVTETVLLQNNLATQAILTAMRDIGVSISMDDFGTGYSSLSYLRNFRIDEIKIDQAFTKTLEAHNESNVIVQAVVGIGQGLGITVCAEGVETESQFAALQKLGVGFAQGFGLYRPMTAEALASVLKA